MSESVEERLRGADDLLRRDDAEDIWLRGAIWLTRIALERSIRAAWERRYPHTSIRGMRNQLLLLTKITDSDTGYRSGVLWEALSRAGHHHHYELTPTVEEVRDWLAQARDVIADLDRGDDRMTPPPA